MNLSEINHKLIESSPIPTLIWNTEKEILFSNEELSRTFQIQNPNEIKTIFDFDSIQFEIKTNSTKKFISNVKYVQLKNGESSNFQYMNFEIDSENKIFCIQFKKLKKNDSTIVLKKQNEILLKLAKSEAIDSGDIKKALLEITESATNSLNCERSSVWVYNEDETAINV